MRKRRTQAQMEADLEAERRAIQTETAAAMSTPELLEHVLDSALEIGSENWDGYLSGNRRPQLEDLPAYQILRERLCGSS